MIELLFRRDGNSKVGLLLFRVFLLSLAVLKRIVVVVKSKVELLPVSKRDLQIVL